MYSHTPSETILKDTSPKITVKTCKNSQNILETSNFGERSFIAKILADLIVKEDAFGFWSEDSSAAAIHLLALFHFEHRICHASYFGHCRPFIFIELPWEIILAAAVDWCCVYDARSKCSVDLYCHCNCNSTWRRDCFHPIDVCCCGCCHRW